MALPTPPLEKPPAVRTGPNRPLQVSVVADDNGLANVLAQAMAAHGRNRIAVFPDVASLNQSASMPDAVLISLAQFIHLREGEPMAYLRLSRRSRIIVVLESRELLDAAQVLAFADAWLFSDINVERVAELVDLGLEGHCLVPAQFLSRLGVDEIRLALLARLSEAEIGTLRLLGQGLNNRTIGDRLGMSEAVVKSIVRSVLSKLHFRNRTEAGVFAARQTGLLTGMMAEGQARLDRPYGNTPDDE